MSHDSTGDTPDPGPIENACEQFESDLRAGSGPRIEAFLAAVEDRHRDELFQELLALELDWRRYVGEDLSVADYQGRFLDRVEAVAEVFARMRGTPAVAPLTETDLDEESSPSPGTARPRVRFRILRLLDSGGTGDVFVALDEQLGREVALKQLQAMFARDPRQCRRFEQEARITGRLEHPGVVPVYAAARRASGVPYFVSKLVRGETLAEAIQHFHEKCRPWDRRDPQAHLALQRLISRFLAVCDTIAYAHDHGVLHRDLKPQNILLGKHGETFVVDWGLARPQGESREADEDVTLGGSDQARDELPPTVDAVGTAGYVSPEQLDGEAGAVGPASDIFALGATLYHLLTDRPPFPADATTRLLRTQMRTGQFPKPRSLHRRIPRALEAVVIKALSARPQDRYGTPRELADDLERWTAGEPVLAWREPVRVRFGRFLKRRPTLSLVLAALLLGGLGFGLFAFQRSVQERAAVETLLRELSGASLEEVPNLAQRLSSHPNRARTGLRTLRDGKSSDSDLALHATLALLPIDPEAAPALERRLRDDPQRARDLVAKLLAIGPSDTRRFEPLRKLLEPVRGALIAPLVDEVRGAAHFDDTPGDDRAAEVLLDYAADAPEVLADVIPDVSLGLFPKYLERLRRSPQVAVQRLERLLGEPLAGWNDLPLDASWRAPDAPLVKRVEAARGLVTPRFAFCQALPLGEFRAVAEALRPCNYRPTRVRPYRDGPLVRVAAVWARDALRWSLSPDLRADQVREEQERQRGLHRWPVDVAAYTPVAGKEGPAPVYLAVWSELRSTSEQARLSPERDVWDVPGRLTPGVSLEVDLARDETATTKAGKKNVASGRRPLTRQRLRTSDGSEWLAQVWYAVTGHALEWPVPETCDARALERRLAHRACVWDLALTRNERSPLEPVYDATFVSGDGLECEAPHGLTPEAHRARCLTLAEGGYWPVAIAAAGGGEPGQVVTASVWHRPALGKGYLRRQDAQFRHARAIAALAWLGRPEARRREQGLAAAEPPRDRDWYVNRHGQTFTVVRGPVTFHMGEPVRTAEDERLWPWHEVAIRRSFAVMTTEVTVRQFQPFFEALARRRQVPDRLKDQDRYDWDDDCPMIRLDWFDAARYCNWLSSVEGISKEQWCYDEDDNGTISLPVDYLSRTGYRLPTETEWEFTCRAGATTNWPFGRGDIAGFPLLSSYAWSIASSAGNRTHPVGTLKPNDLGLFDMLGNVHEWCQDPYDPAAYHAQGPGTPRLDVEFAVGLVPEKTNRVLRGGWFNYSNEGLRATARSYDWAGYLNLQDGFRVARTVR